MGGLTSSLETVIHNLRCTNHLVTFGGYLLRVQWRSDNRSDKRPNKPPYSTRKPITNGKTSSRSVVLPWMWGHYLYSLGLVNFRLVHAKVLKQKIRSRRLFNERLPILPVHKPLTTVKVSMAPNPVPGGFRLVSVTEGNSPFRYPPRGGSVET